LRLRGARHALRLPRSALRDDRPRARSESIARLPRERRSHLLPGGASRARRPALRLLGGRLVRARRLARRRSEARRRPRGAARMTPAWPAEAPRPAEPAASTYPSSVTLETNGALRIIRFALGDVDRALEELPRRAPRLPPAPARAISRRRA